MSRYRYSNRNRVCPDCGATLDPGEICDCRCSPSMLEAKDREKDETRARIRALMAESDRRRTEYIASRTG